MNELAGVLDRLREVRAAERRFLGLWAVEQEVILPGLDRVAADMNDIDPQDVVPLGSGGGEPPAHD